MEAGVVDGHVGDVRPEAVGNAEGRAWTWPSRSSSAAVWTDTLLDTLLEARLSKSEALAFAGSMAVGRAPACRWGIPQRCAEGAVNPSTSDAQPAGSSTEKSAAWEVSGGRCSHGLASGRVGASFLASWMQDEM